jgi:chemotaxis protein MotB
MMEIAHALETAGGGAKRFLVSDHVDDAPLKSKRFHTTWELTASRAAAAVEFLVSQGVPATTLTAAAAGEFDPVSPNDTPENRAKNRRLEIALLPTAEESLTRPPDAAPPPPSQPAAAVQRAAP